MDTSKLEKLADEFTLTQSKVTGILQDFEDELVFKGFEPYGFEPRVTQCSDGILLLWEYPLADELFAIDVINKMKDKGFICPADYGIWDYDE